MNNVATTNYIVASANGERKIKVPRGWRVEQTNNDHIFYFAPQKHANALGSFEHNRYTWTNRINPLVPYMTQFNENRNEYIDTEGNKHPAFDPPIVTGKNNSKYQHTWYALMQKHFQNSSNFRARTNAMKNRLRRMGMLKNGELANAATANHVPTNNGAAASAAPANNNGASASAAPANNNGASANANIGARYVANNRTNQMAIRMKLNIINALLKKLRSHNSRKWLPRFRANSSELRGRLESYKAILTDNRAEQYRIAYDLLNKEYNESMQYMKQTKNDHTIRGMLNALKKLENQHGGKRRRREASRSDNRATKKSSVKTTIGKDGRKYYFKGGRRVSKPTKKRVSRQRTKVTVGRDGRKYYFKGGKRVKNPKR
jgi:hypothetical protein